ncbi:MAG: hypothetical protein CJBNEKGG_03163 [Prosthecobacter sp.]|nr:hypothetical protein [Prosthecobacter sp.]
MLQVRPALFFHWHPASGSWLFPVMMTALTMIYGVAAEAQDFFTSKVEPLLRGRCFECHSHEHKIKGGLTLDSRAGWQKGGESGPVVVPGKPEASLLIQAVSHVEKDLKMPPKAMLPASEIALLEEWVRRGAPDPRAAAPSSQLAADDSWEVEFQRRLDWWSLKPMRQDGAGSVDGFIRAAQKNAGLDMSPQAPEEVLHRRLSFVLTGLPPSDSSDMSDLSGHVEALLNSPHFGEHFARHWMDVVRYTDTYGYEWDNPAKGSHEYRDYLIRAFNDDIGFDQILREHLAGDLLPKPRIHPAAQTNESLIGPMFYHMGEHRHGSSLMFNGIHQEMVNNKIDAFSKAFLATTVACARCHDHKLEAVSQRDYYALAAMFTTPRWTSRVIDAPGKNAAAIARLKQLRQSIRDELAALWTRKGAFQAPALKAWAANNRPSLENAKPHDIAHPLARLLNDTLWLTPQNLRATARQTNFIIDKDHSILATGATPDKDSYTVNFTTEPGSASEMQLEALTHPTLPERGPGRTNRGNFVLNDLRIEVRPRLADGSTGAVKQLKLATARASHAQPGYAVESLLQPAAGRRGWAVGLAPENLDHTARFTFTETVDLPHGGDWTITLEHSYGTGHQLGRFRISMGREVTSTTDAAQTARWQELADEWQKARDVAKKQNTSFTGMGAFQTAWAAANRTSLGWVFEGEGFENGQTDDGTPLIALEGENVLAGLLPRGWHSHALSSKLPGSLRMPPQHLVPGRFVSLNLAGGEFAGHLVVDDHAFQNETIAFYTNPTPQWRSFTDAGLKNGAQQVTIEFCTSSLNPNFPPRTGLAKGLSNNDFGHDKRSWLSITGIVTHDAAGTPQDELEAFASLYHSKAATPWEGIAAWFNATVSRWCEKKTRPGDHEVLNWLLANALLPNKAESGTKLAQLIADYRRVESGIAFPRTVNSMDERDVMPVKYPLNIRGNVDTTGELIEPASLKMLHGERITNRLALAESLLHPEHPLTARVYVNRVWQWIFGTGLVATPDDFGRLGDKPSHPELLDWLAREFIREGWSTKQLVRKLVLSQTFRQGSGNSPRKGAFHAPTALESRRSLDVDPYNRLLTFYPTRRLEAESIRDSLLAVSGRLDPQLYGRPILPFRPAEDGAKRLFTGPLDGHGRRSIYLQMSIMDPPKFLTGFNLPDLKLPTGKRDVTNVPTQALILLNDPFVNAMAKAWTERLVKEKPLNTQELLRLMFKCAFGRQPNVTEAKRWMAALHDFGGDTPESWERLAHAFFNAKEFIYYR